MAIDANIQVIKDINASFNTKTFLDQEIHRDAIKDFKFLCQKTNYTTFNNLNFQTLRTADNHNRYIGEFLVLGTEPPEKQVLFPSGYINTDDERQFVAVVCYNSNGDVEDVLVFRAADFKKAGMFSIFKNIKARGAYGVNIALNAKNLKQYSFGYVLNKL
ncbi:MAG: hypothetical protein FWE53_00455 [Firmicutes bacterium]|nr:hypothetical protein [Bacillota bacterium]